MEFKWLVFWFFYGSCLKLIGRKRVDCMSVVAKKIICYFNLWI